MTVHNRKNLDDDLEDMTALRTDPQEDVGSETFSRFHYQAEVTARHCLMMLRDKTIRGVICEWHEDFLVVRADNSAELVSVKHREKSQGPWTPRGIVDEGGLAKLFNKWRFLNTTVRCILLTNGGLNSEMREIADLIHSREKESLDKASSQLVRLFAKLIPELDPEEVLRFLEALSIDSQLSSRHSIRAVNLEDIARPIIDEFPELISDPTTFYDSLVLEVEEAMRNATGSKGSILRYISDPNRLLLDVARQARIKNRTIIPAQVLALLQEASAKEKSALLSTKSVKTSQASSLEKKLLKGELGPTTINSAKELRAAWSSLEAKYRPDLPFEGDEIQDVRIRVLSLAAEAETAALSAAKSQTQTYGRLMHSELTKRARVDHLGRSPAIPIDDNHLMGLAYQLTDECKIWWSEIFDTEIDDG